MKNLNTRYFLYAIMLTLPFMMTSCQAIGDIFKAGMWVGVVGVVLLVVLIVWIIGKAGK
jgi:hypothetical protein